MLKLLLCGAAGQMGAAVSDAASKETDLQIACRVDSRLPSDPAAGNFQSFSAVSARCDCIVDFSHPSVTDDLLQYALCTKTPVVLCTTGLSEDQISAVHAAAKTIPVFFSANMSLGVNLLSALCQKAVRVLGGSFDIEIIEKHHNRKLDAPSGTALLLANAMNDAAQQRYHCVYDRHSVRQKRDPLEIGIHSVRGGNIVGEHEVLFAGRDEQLSLRHTATSREVFATGALSAARFLCNQAPGLYDMQQLISAGE